MRVRAVRCISRDADSLSLPSSLSLSLSLSLSRARTHTYSFLYRFSPFLFPSHSYRQFGYLLFLSPFLASLLAPPRIRMYECTLARVFFCLFLSTFVSLVLSFFLCPCSSLRSLARSLTRSFVRVRMEAMPPVRRALLPSLRPSSPRWVPPELQLSVPQRFSTASYATNGTKTELGTISNFKRKRVNAKGHRDRNLFILREILNWKQCTNLFVST